MARYWNSRFFTRSRNFIESIEYRKGLKVACIEEIAYRMNYIDADQVRKLAEPFKNNGYGQYLKNLIRNKMKLIETNIEDLIILEPKIFGDCRGYFLESYNKNKFEENFGKVLFVQDNESKSSKGVLRGLHFQTTI